MMPPTDIEQYECSDALAEMLERLRTHQRNFFNSKPGTIQRVESLQNSKRLEKELDVFLQHRKGGAQLKLI